MKFVPILKNKIIYAILCIFLNIFFLSSTCFYPHDVHSISDPDITILSEVVDCSLFAGEVETIYLDVENKGSSDLNYSLTYSSNLILDENTIGLWYFNDVSGNLVLDETENDNHGTVSGAKIADGKFGRALSFDGVDDFVLVSNSQGLNPDSITLDAWINIGSIENMAPISGVKYLSYGILYEDGFIRPHVWSRGVKWYDADVAISLGEWHYVAMTFDSLTGELATYLDGVKIDGRNEGAFPIEVSSSDVIFGRAWTEKMWYLYHGLIDEIRISNIARSPKEISLNYRRGVLGKGEWVKASNPSGIVEAGNKISLEFTFNASGLIPGFYRRELTLFSNDPDTPYLKIPVNLEVLPVNHDIAVSKLTVSGGGAVGKEIVFDALISNLGSSDENHINVELIIDGELIDSTSINSISSNKTINVIFKWIPKYSANYKAEIKAETLVGENIIENNVLHAMVSVSGHPDILVDPVSLRMEAKPGEVIEDSIVVTNVGFADLNYFALDNSGFYVFWDDMEQGVNGWTHSGRQDSWELGEPLIGPTAANSGRHCWGTGLDRNYREFSNCSLITPLIDLSDCYQPILIFTHWFSIDTYYDRGYVEIWDGEKWNTLNSEGYTGYSNGWEYGSYYLNNYSGMNIKIRFRLEADEDVLDKGWFIDDVRVINPTKREGDWLIESPSIGKISPNSSMEMLVTAYTSELNIGRHDESIIIRNNDPYESIVTIPVTLIVQGKDVVPPIANAGNDIVSIEDQIIQFDASNSTDNFEISDYTWFFADPINMTIKGVKTNYNFSTPGNYNIILTVTDTSGNTASHTLFITILDNTKPIANAGDDVVSGYRQMLKFNAKKSTDNVNITSYEWDLGDGAIKNGKEITHSYLLPGVYNVTLIVRDAEGNIGIDNIMVTVESPLGHSSFLLLIFISFIFIIIIVWYQYSLRSRVKVSDHYGSRRY
jgi:hypothetical protein